MFSFNYFRQNLDLIIEAIIELSAVLLFLLFSLPVAAIIALFIWQRIISWVFEYAKFCSVIFSVPRMPSNSQATLIVGLLIVFVFLLWFLNLAAVTVSYKVFGQIQNALTLLNAIPADLFPQLGLSVLAGFVFLFLFLFSKKKDSKVILGSVVSAVVLPIVTPFLVFIVIFGTLFSSNGFLVVGAFVILAIILDKAIIFWFRKLDDRSKADMEINAKYYYSGK
ncbi:MAG: hypothetical protein NTY48_05830 [Candidatus Diapherotrites archaeon]|nr:hypothetical protein [Candidatus Diapherotrites archaeon]